MDHVIANDRLRVEICSRGGELQSIRKDGGEYLWQADPVYWDEKAPNLFPYIARLTEGRYVLDGETYHMSIHGFVHAMEMEAEEKEGQRLVLRLDADEKTRACYPFDFIYRIVYELDGSTLHITYQVENLGMREMYFGVGGHPGFCLPLGQETGKEGNGSVGGREPAFEEYYLEFDGGKKGNADGSLQTDEGEKGAAPAGGPIRIGFSPACFLNGKDAPYPLQEGDRIALRHDLFDEDAIVLRDMPRTVTLKTDRNDRYVRVSYPDMPYLGIWHAVKKPAPYVCIEPWSSLPSRQDVVEDLATQPGLVHLQAGGCYRNGWSIEIG